MLRERRMMYRQGAPPPPEYEQRCLYCGASAFEGATACVCGAPLPPLSRQELPETLWCARCGGQKLCSTPLDPKRYGHHCETCGGLFVGAEAWTRLLSSASTVEAAIIDTSEVPPLPKLHLFPLARCPACGSTMERATFAARSGVAVDVCFAHGIWFDAGELYVTMQWLSGERATIEAPSRVLELRARAPEAPRENGNDVYTRLAAAGAHLALRRLTPWR
jgi:Zn-finger nucleic acid-binding protein